MPRLVEPSESFREAFQSYAKDYLRSGENFWIEDHQLSLEDFPAYIEKLANQAKGIGVIPPRTPSTSFWYLREDGEIVGVSRVRNYVNEWVNHRFGHIGFDIRPSERQKGYATSLLRETLIAARKMGHEKVLLICDADNVASNKVILSNGGILYDQIHSEFSGKPAIRYWIES